MSIGKGWAKGLTKETSNVIAARADKLRGRTKENHQGVANGAYNRSGVARNMAIQDVSIPDETHAKCIECGTIAILGDGMCSRCWDMVR
jgi:hypothetical protein